MIKITPQNIEKHKYRLEELLGEQFINQMEDFETIGLNWYQSLRIETSVHPFAIWWRYFNQDIEKSIEADALQLSEHSMRTLDLLTVLETVKNILNSERIIDSIKKRNKFYSACFEAFMAANYHSKGFKVEIPNEMSDKGIRTSDLVIKSSKDVYIECKSLDDSKLRESPQWTELNHRLSKTLEKYKRNWEINIYANNQINGREKELLYTNIVRDIKNNNLSKKSNFGKFIVEYSKLSEWNQEFFGSISFDRKGEIGFMGGQFMHRNDGIPIHKNIHSINIRPHVERNISNRIISEFKKAIGQIPKEGPGIIHIAIPYNSGLQLLEVVDRAYPIVYKKLNNNSKRINAVVISSTILEKNSQFPFSYNHYIIPNMQTYSELPSDFSIIGTNDLKVPIPDKEGTVEFKFGILEEWKEGTPSFIFDHSTNDGKYQLRVWQTWADKLRMDLFTPSTGRIFVESDKIKLDKNEEYSFAGTWSGKESIIYIDGNKIGYKSLNK